MDKNDIKTTISMNDIACNDFELILIIFKSKIYVELDDHLDQDEASR